MAYKLNLVAHMPMAYSYKDNTACLTTHRTLPAKMNFLELGQAASKCYNILYALRRVRV